MEKKGIAKSIEPFLEKIESLSQVQRIIISVGSFVVIAGIFIYFLYLPKYEKINSLKKQLTDLEQKLSTAKRNAADLKKFQAKMKEAEAQFNMAMKKLPETKEIPSLLTAISDSGQQVGLEFLLFEPKKEKKKEFYAEIPVAMSLRGDYHNLAIFFDQVARLNRIVNITNIQMTRAKGKGKAAGELLAKCTAVTYKFLDEPPKKKK
ncbi:MAG: type 4a pilus biogenesis protein PilO, partial [Deltaproteobacteria bacterium]|nr:type 4a pilus biogenesis protein PilO [Deltaproteobacteria bacterium]